MLRPSRKARDPRSVSSWLAIGGSEHQAGSITQVRCGVVALMGGLAAIPGGQRAASAANSRCRPVTGMAAVSHQAGLGRVAPGWCRSARALVNPRVTSAPTT